MMKRVPLLLAALLLGACASSSDVQKLQARISELQDQLAGMKRTTAAKEEVQNVTLRIAEQTETLLKSSATLVAKVDQIDQRIENTTGTVEQTNYRIDRLVQQLTQQQQDVESLKQMITSAASGGQAPPPVSGATPTPAMTEVNVPAPQISNVNPMDIYRSSYLDYQKGNFDLAIQGFRDFLAESPNTDLADNASYWIGESLFSQKKYPEAIAQFDAVVNKYPKSDKVPGALLKKGYSYISLNERAQGIVQLQYVLHEHPTSQEASLARQRLKQLGVETR